MRALKNYFRSLITQIPKKITQICLYFLRISNRCNHIIIV